LVQFTPIVNHVEIDNLFDLGNAVLNDTLV
jgi:hypothetical protein